VPGPAPQDGRDLDEMRLQLLAETVRAAAAQLRDVPQMVL
jgi:hypothetical protein